MRVEQVAAGQTLGALRNVAVALARGDWVCQWDDDDRYHPERLQLQWDCARSAGAAVNYLVDQLHWFSAEALLCWDDWSAEAYPMNFVQGTLLARRDVLPPYPDVARGEDTLQTHALLRADATLRFGVSRLEDHGWCYVYRFHGGNVWDAAHHRAISSQKHLSPARLLPRLDGLRRRLAEYRPPLPLLHMPTGSSLVAVSGGQSPTASPRPETSL
jgi:glycosyltransferase involved in cell wall biosynthesis